MSLTMKQLKGEIDILAELMKGVLERMEHLERPTQSPTSSFQIPTDPIVFDIERHIPRPLLEEMIRVMDANSHKDVDKISLTKVLMEMQVELGKIAIESANDPADVKVSSIRSYLIDLMNYSVIMWRKLDLLEDDWLD